MLTPEQEEQFYTQGYIVLRGAFPRADSLTWVRAECARRGYDLDDPATWTKEYDRVDTERHETLADYAPAAWEASCDLLGGEDRVGNRPGIGLFAVNFRQGADRPYQPPSPAVGGWHIDGWNFRHFLDSPEPRMAGRSTPPGGEPGG
ncbi:MAG: hypothetical protein JO250_12200 [Armatimonadetes bacterium]|nr:hypothetical protein [Armatimonadota bacterium]